MPTTPVLAPLVNPNEPEAVLQAIHAPERGAVSMGDALCTLETTKSTLEVAAPEAGYVVGWRYAPGQLVPAGETLCYIAETEEETPPQSTGSAEKPHPDDRRFTQPALALAREYALDLESFPAEVLVTEALVKEYIEAGQKKEQNQAESGFDPTAILVYGGGGHGKALIELLRAQSAYRIVGIIDDGLSPGIEILGIPMLGGRERLPDLFKQGVCQAVNAVGGIGNTKIRIEVFRHLAQAGFTCPAVVHPTAFVEQSAHLSPGVQVMPHAYVGSEASVGFGVIVNTGAVVSHDCVLGEFANISPSAILAGEVEIGSRALVGMGVTVNLQVKVGAGARLGNGATVKTDVPENGVVRAGTIWPE